MSRCQAPGLGRSGKAWLLAGSGGADEPADGGHQLVQALGALLAGALGHAVADVVVEQLERDGVERLLDGADLRQHLDAVAVVLDHARNPAHLSLDAGQALRDLLLPGRVAGALARLPEGNYTPTRYLSCGRRAPRAAGAPGAGSRPRSA